MKITDKTLLIVLLLVIVAFAVGRFSVSKESIQTNKNQEIEDCYEEGGEISFYKEDETGIRLLCRDSRNLENDLFEIKINRKL